MTKTQATQLAQMAHDGLARTIYPIHTPADGDTILGLSTDVERGPVDMTKIGALAAQVMADAVVRAATEARRTTGLSVGP